MTKIGARKIGKLEVLLGEECEELSEGRKKFELKQYKTEAKVWMVRGSYYEAFAEHLLAYTFCGEKIMTPKQIQRAVKELVEEPPLEIEHCRYEVAQAMLEHAGLEEEAKALEETVSQEKASGGGFHRGLLEQCLYRRMYHHRLLEGGCYTEA